MTPWPEARLLAIGCTGTTPAELLPLTTCAGRTLAAPVSALAALPPFDVSAMDGWAVRGPAPWTVVGRVLAGDPPPAAVLLAGQAVEVATGAVVPRGTEGVLPYEVGIAAGDLVEGLHPGARHVRRTGEECGCGELLLAAGEVLTPAALGLAAAVGAEQLAVRQRPRVACLITGSELLTTGVPEAGRIRDAVGPLLLPAIASYGGQVVVLRHVPDRRGDLLAALEGVAAEVVVTTGSSSTGPADHLSSVLAELGADMLVDGVAVKPGHPQVLAQLPDRRTVVGLPGNPLAALVGLVTLLEPVLRGLLGRPVQELTRAPLSEDLPASADDHRLVPVRLSAGRAVPTTHRGAAMLRGAACATAFAVVAPGVAVRAGDAVQLVPLP